MVTLPYELGGRLRDEIDSYRRKNNIPEPDEVKQLSVYRRRDTFLESEFELIKELHINEEVLDYLDLFPNVTSVHFDLSSKLGQGTIQQIINRYPNMTDLSVKGQSDVQYLDLSKLTKLQNLSVMNNKSLHRIAGLENLTDMFHFTFYNNESYNVPNEVCEASLKYAYDGADVDLDVLYYKNMDEIISQSQEKKQAFELSSSSIKWDELVGLGSLDSTLQYSSGEVGLAYKKAVEVVSKYIKETDTPEQKYAILYQWMCENVKYDYNSLDTRDRVLVVDGVQRGRKGGTNGTVNSLVYGSCVCQGYSKGMQMLLKVAGLDAFDVECIVEEKNKNNTHFQMGSNRMANIGDHSIQKVNLGGKIYYSDVTWDAGRTQRGDKVKYFLLSKEDILLDHKLVGEGNVISNVRSYAQAEQEEMLKFASERIKEMNQKKEEKSEQKKTNEEYLEEYTAELNKLREQYGKISTAIEELMIRNSQSPIPNYQQQLENLISQRDLINEKMEQTSSSRKTYEWVIQNEKETEHKNRIGQVERLLGIHITSNAGFVYDNELQVPRFASKDTSTLRQEQGKINQQLDELYYDGQIDHKVWQSMKKEIRIEYDKMIASAPKPINQTQVNTPQNGEVQNTQQNTQETSTVNKEETTEKIEDIPEKFASAYDRVYDSELIESMREKYGYADMTEEEQERFDEQLQKSMKEMKAEETVEDKKSSADLRREAWEKIRTQYFSNPDLDLEAIIRQQEFNEMQREEIEQMEQVNNVEGHRRGMF